MAASPKEEPRKEGGGDREGDKGKAKATLRESIPSKLDGSSDDAGKATVTRTQYTPQAPLLCTGFEGSVRAAASHLFKFAGDEDADDEEVGKGDDAGEVDEAKEDLGRRHDRRLDRKHGDGGCLAGAPLLTEHDESAKVPGVFLVGPEVSHGTLSFCFVYKFRQRFAIVAERICEGLGIDTRAAVAESREANMYLDDLSCCTEGACGDVC